MNTLNSLSNRVFLKRIYTFLPKVRTFLSGAYSCNEVWNQRKRSDIFKNIDYDDLYHQLDRSFQIGQRISVLDVDLFVNGVDGDLFQRELQDVIFKLRLNPECVQLSERTMHAVVRYFMAIKNKTSLLEILSDRLNYGIFLDNYSANLLMDQFLKDGDNLSAVKIAVLQMFQEDFNHPILKILSIHSCISYINSSEVWAAPKEPEIDPDDEEVRVRVSFIRNSYFDDHFDLVEPNNLIGKTLYMAGSALPGPVGLSAQIVGLILYEKYDKCTSLIKEIIASKTEVYEHSLQKALEYIRTPPKKAESETKLENENEPKAVISAIEELLQKGNLLTGNFEDVVSKCLVATVAENEAKDIQSLTELYRCWEKERENHIAFEIYESKKRTAAQQIAETKDDLKKREEMIFYFDKEDEWKLKVEQKLEEQRILAEEESKIKKKDKEEEYIPPDVKQRRS